MEYLLLFCYPDCLGLHKHKLLPTHSHSQQRELLSFACQLCSLPFPSSLLHLCFTQVPFSSYYPRPIWIGMGWDQVPPVGIDRLCVPINLRDRIFKEPPPLLQRLNFNTSSSSAGVVWIKPVSASADENSKTRWMAVLLNTATVGGDWRLRLTRWRRFCWWETGVL